MKSPSLPLALFCFLLTSLPASAQQPGASGNSPTQDAQFASVAGQVLRADTGEPLKKARILLTSERDNSIDPYIAITDAEGRFLINGIRPGRYSMRVERDGFISTSEVDDNSGNASSIVSLKAGQQLAGLMFHLQKCAVISGRVFDEDGDPAREVTVEALIRVAHRGKINTGEAWRVTTNDLGEYRLFYLWPGQYFLRASMEQRGGTIIGRVTVDDSILRSVGGYIPTYYPSSGDISRASSVEAKAGEEISGVNITLLRQQSYKVKGQVFNAAVEHPVSSAQVGIIPKGVDSYGPEDTREAGADQKTGEFELDDVRPGTYTLVATYRDGESEFLGTTEIEVVNQNVTSARIFITRGAELYGRVLKEGKIASAPVHVNVSLTPRDNDAFAGRLDAETKPDGTFSILGIRDGVYDIFAYSFACNVCYLKSATVNGADLVDTGLTVSSGSAPSPIQLVLSSRSATVNGTVNNDDGSPVPGATIVLVSDLPRHDENRDLYRSATTDQSGYFVIPGIAPGKYHGFAWKNVDSNDYEDPDFRQPFLPKAQAFSVSEDEKKTLQLTLLPSSADTQ
jgi:protocatechuate 3,4-dioxygenase beta subunit